MRLIFVNHAHPQIKHVSGMRLSHFAIALANRGHQVVIVSSALPETTSLVRTPSDLEKALEGDHRWPLTVAVPPFRRRSLEMIRGKRIPSLARRVLTVTQFVLHGGVFEDWVSAVRPLYQTLVMTFRPDLVWGTFGNTSNLVVAQGIARASGCPWVMDIKDNWRAYLRPGLRELMANRFADASGYTANSMHHERIATRWLHQRAGRIIYSGVADQFFDLPELQASTTHDLVLVGSIRNPETLRSLLKGIGSWAATLPSADLAMLRVVYAGSEGVLVDAMARETSLPCAVVTREYLSLGELAVTCRRAVANCYLWSPATFHHKLMELLVCGRPVISFPGEAPESFAIAVAASTRFVGCEDAESLGRALQFAWERRNEPPREEPKDRWSWASFSADLEDFFKQIVLGTRT